MSVPGTPDRSRPPAQSPELEGALALVEQRLSELGASLRQRDSAAIDLHATELHRALAKAVDHFSRAARGNALPQALRHRLASAGGEVAAQRESLARATAALDRAIDVLMPRESVGLYSNQGATDRVTRSGSLLA